ncbi:BglII/BstYI family type II restriction endonuclease [Burkholderia gladioli]|uniref:BglII/BstYI family type II restriction endonuclease n=1 Tax=Burkholderia gladioli TaxID=28095 RepID=UPI001640338E|nr:BglII/BstYI family type II restriction endonuclease [Burkholderia gladioli]
MYETATYNDPAVLPPDIRARWTFLETSSAAAVLRAVCQNEWSDILHVLRNFQLIPNQWLRAGGNRGTVAREIDGMFHHLGWQEMRVDLRTQAILVSRNGTTIGQFDGTYQEGYLVDNFKGRVALDVEWNAKDGNLDRDLSAYRAWHEAGVISAAVLITQDRTSLKYLADNLWRNHQATLPEALRNPRLPIDLDTSTTTNLEKARLRVRRGIMGTCPLLVVAANQTTWDGQRYSSL